MEDTINNLPYHIYWFSGCGNSLIIALEIKTCLSQLGYTVKLFPLEKTDPSRIAIPAVVGFVVPVAGQGTYPLVWDFIHNLPYVDGLPCFLVDTLGLYSGGILGPIKSMVRKKGFVPIAATEILMPNVFQKRRNAPEKEAALVEKGKRKARKFCNDLISGKGKWVDIPAYSWFLSLFYRSKKLVAFYRKMFPLAINPDVCKRCGLCVKLCPVGHLSMTADKSVPKQGHTCILCHRCFVYCPSKAITIGDKKAIAYHAISIRELLSNLKSE